MKAYRRLAWLAVVVTCSVAMRFASAAELAILSEKTWDRFVPQGKEVDAIYGDFVLRNDRIGVVIANAVPGRHANMKVRDVGGCVIDLTVRQDQSDQLSAYYPGARRFPYQIVGVTAEGNVTLELARHHILKADRLQLATGDAGFLSDLKQAGGVLRADMVRLECMAPAAPDRPQVRLSYTLRDGKPYVEIHSEFLNFTDKRLQLATLDDFRAERTFESPEPGRTELVWVYDKWWGQAYGVVAPGTPMRLSGNPAEPRVIEFLHDDRTTITLAPGETLELTRYLVSAAHLVGVTAVAQGLLLPGSPLIPLTLAVRDTQGEPVPSADVELSQEGSTYALARTGSDGTVRLELPPGTYQASVSALARGSKQLSIEVRPGGKEGQRSLTVQLSSPPRVVAHISDVRGGPIPCKVQFTGVEGTPDPFFFPDTGEHAVHNLYYSHNGRFTQEIPPGIYDVLISYGPEYDVEKGRIVARPGQEVPLRATLRRVVQSPGWISSDFHSHSSPSGDNVSSQRGRVLNLLCEHIEFAPCTEHNRLSTYVPHLKALGVEHLMATCTGIELTGSPGSVNHQNSFPLVMKPRTQDHGAPLRDADPEVQTKRLALWDNNSDKLVQSNHPDMGEMFFDRDGDGEPDGGFKGMFAYQDLIEVHPHQRILQMQPAYRRQDAWRNNTIFNWLQLLNQGRRLPGAVNTDAHYNFHGSGWRRNYIKCDSDDPAKIDTLDIVHASEKGRIIITNGPYLEVAMYTSGAGNGSSGEPHKAIPGDDLALPGGVGTLHVRVQCPNWFDIDRVQVLLGGRPVRELNWTRSANSDAFSDGVVKFDRRIPIEIQTDTHVLVVATGENSRLGSVMGPSHAQDQPTAVSNPIFVDVDGGGFQPNGDTLGHPLPVKGGRPAQPAN